MSVVVAVGPNRENLGEALDSIAQQTFRDYELLLQEEPGLSEARNAGIRRAKGEYVAIMDADDISYPLRFETQVSYLDQHQDVSVVGSWGDRIGDRSGVCSPPEDVKLRHLFMWDRVIHTSAMMRKSDLPAGPYRPVLFEDWDLWIRLARAGRKIRNIQRPLVAFRFSEDGHSAKVPRMVWYMEQVNQRIACLV